MRWITCLFGVFIWGIASQCPAQSVRSYTAEVEVPAGQAMVPQRRWYLENELVRLAVTDDPGGAVVEYLHKPTGTDYVAGTVSSQIVDGKPVKSIGWGWKNTISDDAADPPDKQLNWQPFTVEFEDRDAGAKAIKVTGHTAEQQIERWHILRPGSAELTVEMTLTNISDHPRRLWLRWHPYAYGMADKFGDSGVVLSPGEGSEVRKIRVGWGWDHWFETHDGYWLAADFRQGDGLFMTFEKEKVPIHYTWTYYRSVHNEKKGSITFEPFPQVEIKGPGESLSASFSYLPFTADTPIDAMPMGVLKDKDEQQRARDFLQRVKPLNHLQLFGPYTFANTLQFHWHHRRRDLLGIREWGFMDCAIVGFPYQEKATRVRFVGGVFDEAASLKSFPAANPRLTWRVTIRDRDGEPIYKSNFYYDVRVGVPGSNQVDAEISIPMAGVPDGAYQLLAEALDPTTNKPFHKHETEVVIFGDRVKEAQTTFAEELRQDVQERPFVTALGKLDTVAIKDGVIRLPIGVEEGGGMQHEAFPVCLGVPFPQGQVQPTQAFALQDPEGKPVNVETRPMNQWPDGSLKWLQVDFQASCPANGFVFYTLVNAEKPAEQPPLATESEAGIEVRNGPLLIRIPKGEFNGIGTVFLDRNGDGDFSDDEQAILPAQSGDTYWAGDAGQTYRMGLQGAASYPFTPGVSIEENGSQRAVIRIEGWYSDGQGHHPAYGELRLEFHRGQAWFKIWHQVTFTGSPWHDQLSAYGLRLRFPAKQYQEAVYDIDGQAVRQVGPSHLYQSADNRVTVTAGRQASHGEHASGAVSLRGLSGSVLVYHPELWQRYPKAYTVDPAAGTLDLQYWPREAGLHGYAPEEEYWIPSSSSAEACGTGASRTEEIVVDFSNLVEVTKADEYYGEPVVACTPPQWVCDTQVLGSLDPYDPARHPRVDSFIRELIDFYDRNRELYRFYGHFDYGTNHNVYEVPLYNWLRVGRYANIGNEENIQRGPWLAWFRSGDRRYLKFATSWTRHLMEVQSIRWHNTFPEWIGMSRRHHRTTWIGGGDWGHTMIDPFLEYYHATGYRPAWDQAVRAAKTMANTHEGKTWRYISNPIIANTRMYLETGDPQYKAVADRLWNEICAPDRAEWYYSSHGSRMARWYGQLNDQCRQLWLDWARNGYQVGDKTEWRFDYIDSYGDLYKATGDIAYAHAARIRFDTFVDGRQGQLAGQHPIYRGMIPTITQFTMGHVRESAIAAGAIADSRAAFPAAYYGLINTRGIYLSQETDAPITLYLSTDKGAVPATTGPDGQAVTPQVETIYAPRSAKGLYLLKLTLPADGLTGIYHLSLPKIDYLGSSEPHIAIRTSNHVQGGAGAPLFVDTSAFPQGCRYRLTAAPATSLQISTQSDECLCTETLVRPQEDAVFQEGELHLPTSGMVKLESRWGVKFPDLTGLMLYLNANDAFHLPEAAR